VTEPSGAAGFQRGPEEVKAMLDFDPEMESNHLLAENDELEVTFTGVIRPVAWDENDNPVEVEIQPSGRFEDPQSVRVDPDCVGQELASYLFSVVTVTGNLRRNEYGEKIIYVTDYEIEDVEEVLVPPLVRRWEPGRPRRPIRPDQGRAYEKTRAGRRVGRGVRLRRHRRLGG
jgi:hypothetical protein